jgi:hypothetical protein
MTAPGSSAPGVALAFLLLMGLAALVAALAAVPPPHPATRAFHQSGPSPPRPARRARELPPEALSVGAAVFLAQFILFVLLSALGTPALVAEAAALGLGVMAACREPLERVSRR